MKITMRHLFLLLYVCLAAGVLAGFLVHQLHLVHPHFWWEEIPVFSAIYGFVGCVVIIVASKALGHHWLQKEEDYYEKH
jgi:drug/metabolite transporter (DMT)-like permease